MLCGVWWWKQNMSGGWCSKEVEGPFGVGVETH
jgi:hypothetical protein